MGLRRLSGACSSPGDFRWALAGPQRHGAVDPRKMWVGRDCQNSDVSHRAVRDLIVKIARYARYDGSILSIGTSDNSLSRMEVRNWSDRLHLDLQFLGILILFGFSAGHTDVTAPNPYSVWVGRSSENRLIKSRDYGYPTDTGDTVWSATEAFPVA